MSRLHGRLQRSTTDSPRPLLASRADVPLCWLEDHRRGLRAAAALRAQRQRELRTLGAGDAGYSLHSWRRGSATTKFLVHGSIDKTMAEGRWTSARTARDYVTEGAAILAENRLTKRQVQVLSQWAGALDRCFPVL